MNPQELGNAFVDKQEIHQEEDVGTKQAEESDLVEAIEPRLEKALLRKVCMCVTVLIPTARPLDDARLHGSVPLFQLGSR